MGEIGVPELLIILAIIIVIFGPGKLAGLGAALGAAIRDFRRAVRPDDQEHNTQRSDRTPR